MPLTPSRVATPPQRHLDRQSVDLVFGSNSELRAIAESTRAATRRKVRARLRGRVGEGHEPRPVRHRVVLSDPDVQVGCSSADLDIARSSGRDLTFPLREGSAWVE